MKPGGRLAVSDMVLLKELPDVVKQSVAAYVGCLSGANHEGCLHCDHSGCGI